MKGRGLRFVSFLVVCISILGHSQEKVPLQQFISDLESRYDVKFSYSIVDVKDVLIDIPDENLAFEAIITYLNENTNLNFKLITDRYITISTLNKTITICGTVKIKSSLMPLFGVTINIKGSGIGVISDDQGQFELKDVPINSNVLISYLGFETIELDAIALRKDAKCKELLLNEKTEELGQVIISKFLTTGIEKARNGSTVINIERFGILPGLTDPDVLQSIQALPGVESINESIANINVRGGANDQNFILWDGIRMYHSGHFFGLISAYNPYLTDKVEVIKNGTSAEYGDGVSSSINMYSDDELNNELSGGFGFNLLHADAFFKIPVTDRLSVHVSGRRSYTDLVNSPTYDQYFERSFQDSELTTNSDNIDESSQQSEFYFYDFTAKVLFDLNENHKFRANVIGIYNNLDYLESFTNNANETESKTSNLRQENLGLGGAWDALWSKRLSTQLTGFYTTYQVSSTDFRVESDQELFQENEVIETGIKLNSNYTINEHISLLGGYQFNEIGILNATIVSAPSLDRTKKDVLLNHAAYAEGVYTDDNTYISAGIRANYFQTLDRFILEPRVNIRQSLSKTFAVSMQGEFKNQSSTQIIDFQDDFLGVENRRWILADDQTIPISESKQASLGIEYYHNNLLIDLKGYYKVVNGITASNQGFNNNIQFINAIGSYDVTGLEFLINKTSNTYSVWLSYTYGLNNYEFSSLSPSEFPNNIDIRHSISLAFNYDIFNNLKCSIGGIWRTGQPFTIPVEGNETVQDGNDTFVNYDIPNSQNLDNFMRVDASLDYKFSISEDLKSELRIGVLNLFNRENILNTYYEVDPNDANAAIKIENKSLGLTPNISFRINF